MTPDEQTLLAYVDGQLDHEQAVELEAALAQDAAASEIVNQLRATSPDMIKAALDVTLQQPVPREMEERIRQQRYQPSWRVLRIPHAIAASVLLLVLGFAGGYLLSDVGVEPEADTVVDLWIMRVAQYQLLYGRETLALEDPSAAVVRDTELRLGSRLGLDLRIPDLDRHGLAFKRGQLLSFGDEPLVQLTYLPQAGKPIAYCITATDRPDSAPEAGKAEGLELFHWRHNGFAHVVIGVAEREHLRLVAQTAYSRNL